MNGNLIDSKNNLLHTWECVLVCITVFLYLKLRSFVPLDVMSTAGYDDAWFMHAASQLLQFKWFGAYDHATLIKGPMYPFFLVLTSISGISLQTTTAIFHLIAACLLIYTLSPYIKSFFVKYLFFILTLFIQFPIQRVIRDEFSLSILIIVISLSVLVFLEERINKKKILASFLGLLLSVFVLTREDGFISFAPPLIFLYVLSILLLPSKIKERTVSLIIVFAIVFTSINAYKLVNFFEYRSYVGVELLDKDYQNALNAIYRVREGPSQKYVEVTNTNLDAIYKISPTLNELSPFINNAAWKAYGCSIDSSTCGQTGTGYFMWSLREAVSRSGYYSNPSNAKIIYRKISSEINEACKVKKIRCEDSFLSKIPGFDMFNFSEFAQTFYQGILASRKVNNLETIGTSPSNDRDLDYSDLLNITYMSQKEKSFYLYRLTGWFYDEKNPTNWFNVSVESEKNKNIYADVERKASEDIKYHFNEPLAANQRYNIFIPCFEGSCSLSVNNLKISDNLKSFTAGQYIANGIFHVDEVKNLVENRMSSVKTIQSNKTKLIFNNLASFYNSISSYILSVGIFSLLLLLVMSFVYKSLTKEIILCLFIWATYFWKIFFLSAIQFFWLPSGLNFLYLYPSIVLLPIASFFSLLTLINSFIKIKCNKSFKSYFFNH